jgi:hypothetical protein
MACDMGQRYQDEFDKAVAVRAQFEANKVSGSVLMEAKIKESSALQKRSFHIRDCAECWVSPPRLRKAAGSVQRLAGGALTAG